MDLIGIRHWLAGGAVRVNESLLARREGGRVVNCGRGRRGPKAVLDRRDGDGQAVHGFSLYTSHDRLALEFAHFLSKVPVRFLGVVVRLERHVPRPIMSKFAGNKMWTVFTRENILKFTILRCN